MNQHLNGLLAKAKRASGAISYFFLLLCAFKTFMNTMYLYGLFHIGFTEVLTPIWWMRELLGILSSILALFLMFRFFRNMGRLENPFAPRQATSIALAGAFWLASFIFSFLLPDVGLVSVVSDPISIELAPSYGISVPNLIYAAVCFVLFELVRYANELKIDSDSII